MDPEKIFAQLLFETLKKGVEILIDAGVGDKARSFLDDLFKVDQKRRLAAINKAYQYALANAPANSDFYQLLSHEPFQKEVIRALLDPVSGFNFDAVRDDWTAKFPQFEEALRDFFADFRSAVAGDKDLGPLLQRYQELRRENRKTLRSVNVPAGEKEIIQSVYIQIIHQNQFIIQPQSDAQSEQRVKRDKARKNYLNRFRTYCHNLPLGTLGGDESTEEEVTLDKVYIELDTTLKVKPDHLEDIRAGKVSQIQPYAESAEPYKLSAYSSLDERRLGEDEKRSVPLPVLEAVLLIPRCVLLGAAGSGKSSFVKKFLAVQASCLLGQCQPLRGVPEDCIPVLVVLRELAVRIALLDLASLSEERKKMRLASAVREQIIADLANYAAQDFAPDLEETLNNGRVLLAFDGLDEVPQEIRPLIRQAVGAFLQQVNPQHVIITCRIRSYGGKTVFPQYQSSTIAPLDEEKIGEFVTGWYRLQVDFGRVPADHFLSRVKDLKEAALSSDLEAISRNPMMLTSMAIVHQGRIGLPRERVKLYQEIVDIFLRRWQRYKQDDLDALGVFLRNDLLVRSAVERLAYEAQRTMIKEKKTADLARGTAVTILESREYMGSTGLADKFLDYIDQRAGILIGQGGDEDHPSSYGFPHRTFQEYLAGCYLAGQKDLRSEFFKHAREGDAWDMAAQLAFEELKYNRRGKNILLGLAYALSPDEFPRGDAGQRALLWSGKIAVLLGNDEIEQDNLPEGAGRTYLKRLRPQLVQLLSGKLPPVERAEAGRALAVLGDPRLEIMTGSEMHFCRVPAGKFWMGELGKVHPFELPEFYISRFPVSVAQYREFAAAGGYKVEKYWGEARAAGYWKPGKGFRDRLEPYAYSAPYSLDNHPAVGVSWYEALAYTRWLEETLRARGSLQLFDPRTQDAAPLAWGRKWEVRLPSEAEWEKAARGTTDFFYPWGKEITPNHANWEQTLIESTSALGCFPLGASPYGVEEMAGNVWEWTRSEYRDYPYVAEDGREELKSDDPRVLRGGAFSVPAQLVRCAYRWNFPVNELISNGFRVVVSPLS